VRPDRSLVPPLAGVLLLIASLLDLLQGASAVAEDELYTQAKEYLYEMDLTAWGWIHIVIGVLGAVVAVAILARRTWGLVAGLAVAVVGIVTNVAFLPVYPAWSAFIIGFNVLVLLAMYAELDVRPRPDLRPDPMAALRDYRE
jgi:hypothetical protein